jgi:hypothetical protein
VVSSGCRLVAPYSYEESGKPTYPQLGGLLFRLGEADQLMGHGQGARRRAGKLSSSQW